MNESFLYGEQTRSITYSDFINKELILFSNADNERSIPSMVDGLKPGGWAAIRQEVWLCKLDRANIFFPYFFFLFCFVNKISPDFYRIYYLHSMYV